MFVVTLPMFLKPAAGEEHEPPHWSVSTTTIVLGSAAVGAAFTSDWFVDALTPAIHTLHMSEVFAGLVIVAIAGNAVENVVGVQLAARNKPDFAISVIISSSLQVALALTPALVFISLAFSTHLTLVFPPLLAFVLLISAVLGALVVNDGESTWQEGVILVGFYFRDRGQLLVGRLRSDCTRSTVAPVRRTRSAGASSSCRPRRPALTRIVSQASAEESTVVGSRRRWPSGLMPPDDVARGAFGSRLVGERRALADGAEIELPVGRKHEGAERAVGVDDERLEQAAGGQAECSRDRDRVVTVAHLDSLVLVQAVDDARALRRLDGRRHSPSSSARSASANSRHASSVSAARNSAPSRARGRSRRRMTSASMPRRSCVEPLIVVEIGGERLHGAIVDAQLAVRVAPGREQQQRAPSRCAQLLDIERHPLAGQVREHRQRVAELAGVDAWSRSSTESIGLR